MPSFRISPPRGQHRRAERHGTPQSSQYSQQAEHLPDCYGSHYFQPQSWRSSVGETMEDPVLRRRSIPVQLLYRQALSGINVLLLWLTEYNSPFWLTFKQAQALKGSVRKGGHGTPIAFYRKLPEYAENDGEINGENERVPFVLCHYTVSTWSSAMASRFLKSHSPPSHRRFEDEVCESIVTGWRAASRSISTAPPDTVLNTAQAPIPPTCPPVDALWMHRTITALYFIISLFGFRKSEAALWTG